MEIDNDLLKVARMRAHEQGITLGAAVSELMRRGLEVPTAISPSGFPVFVPPVDAPEITADVVARYRDDDVDE